MNKVITTIAFVLMICFLTISTAYAQKQSLIGLNLTNDIYPEAKFAASIGGTFETQITRHSGGETGLYYRTSKISDVATYTDASGSHSVHFTVVNRYLTVPVLYKYYSKALNFSVGPGFEFFAGSKQQTDEFPFEIESSESNPAIKVGFLTKASKVFPLNKKFVIEPEIRFGSVQTFDEATLGIGIAAKYRL